MITTIRRTDPGSRLRWGLIGLTVVGILGTAFELASERHWATPIQLVPWAALGVLSAAVVVLVLPKRRHTVLVVRILALMVLGISLFGVFEHVLANYAAGPLDRRYADTWDTLPAFTQWWYAITKTVGAAPVLAPGMLGQSALLLALATIGLGRPAAARRAPPRVAPQPIGVVR